jgi:outer membrane protein OmpA-like peptidoglycan-associated protein
LVFFDWDKSNLSPQVMATISQAAAAYKSNGSARITDVGNIDTSGSSNFNTALSLRRADAVKGALIQNGVPAAAIETSGRGSRRLTASASRRTGASSLPACRGRRARTSLETPAPTAGP